MALIEDPMALIMDSAAHTRDRLDRLREGEVRDRPVGLTRKNKTYIRKCQHGHSTLKCELCDRDRKIEVLDRLCRRQSDILTGVAIAMRGEPDESSNWSHHDLVERAQNMMKELESLRVSSQIRDTTLPGDPEYSRTPQHISWMTRLNRTFDRQIG